eukprot:12902667-Prorocentrum_lima.AAC.1
MSYQCSALPLKVHVAVGLDVDNGSWAPPAGKIFVGGLFSKIQSGRQCGSRSPELPDVFWIAELDCDDPQW